MRDVAKCFLINGGCACDSFFALSFQGEGAIWAMKGGIALSPQRESKFPNGINCGAHPLVWGEGGAWLLFTVAGLNGRSPIFCDTSVEEVVPSDLAL